MLGLCLGILAPQNQGLTEEVLCVTETLVGRYGLAGVALDLVHLAVRVRLILTAEVGVDCTHKVESFGILIAEFDGLECVIKRDSWLTLVKQVARNVVFGLTLPLRALRAGIGPGGTPRHQEPSNRSYRPYAERGMGSKTRASGGGKVEHGYDMGVAACDGSGLLLAETDNLRQSSTF
jgi:hypothetical protein